MFRLQRYILENNPKPSNAVLRVCLRLPANHTGQGIDLTVKPTFPGISLQELRSRTYVAASNNSSTRNRHHPCFWTDIDVRDPITKVFQHMVSASVERGDLRFFVRANMSARSKPVRMARGGRVDHLPVLALWKDEPLDAEIVAYEEAQVTRQKRQADKSPCRQGDACGSDDPYQCQPTNSAANGSLELDSVIFRLSPSELTPYYKADSPSPDPHKTGANVSESPFYNIHPKNKILTVHRCRGSCTHIPDGQPVPFHVNALNHMKIPNSSERKGLCCRATSFADVKNAFVRLPNDPYLTLWTVRLKQIHAKTCDCMWS